MKKKEFKYGRAKKLYRLTALMLLLFCCFSLLPAPAHAADVGYDITAYNVDITVGSDNVFHVTETISVNFRIPSHGIYRYIPYKQVMDWNINGTSKRIVYNIGISSVNVFSDSYQTSYQNGNMVIKIGSADKLLSGKKVYKISYDYSIGNDQVKTQDFIYYNIIGTNWDCSISNVTFNVTLPKSFDNSKLWFYTGPEGSASNAPVQSVFKDNTISGTLNKTLNPNEALTIQMDLPEGYFSFSPGFPWQQIIMTAAILVALLTLILFILFGRDNVLVKPVEFYPPDNITSAEAGYIIDTTVDEKDVVSLIIYWASKGYLTIEQIEKNDFRLTKIKDLPHVPNEYEKYFFSALFSGRDTVLVSDITQKTFAQFNETKNLIRAHYSVKERRLYSRRSSAFGGIMLFIAAIPVLGSIFLTIYRNYSITMALGFSIISTLLIFMPITYLKSVAYRWHVMKGLKKGLMLIFGAILEIIVLFAYYAYMNYQGMPIVGIAVAASILVTGVICIFMRKRTPYGNEMLGKLLGFRNFLEVTEKDRIERLVEENPSYFYDVLPYAYVLGVSDKWAKKFEGIAMQPPSWYIYDQSHTFSTLLFYNMMFRSMNTMRVAMVTPPVQTSRGGFGGGGFGGGGFSGGGFGGGGGGRW